MIALRHDVIAGKHASRSVPWDIHSDTFGNSGINHVPDGGASEVMAQAAWDASGLTGSGMLAW